MLTFTNFFFNSPLICIGSVHDRAHITINLDDGVISELVGLIEMIQFRRQHRERVNGDTIGHQQSIPVLRVLPGCVGDAT